MTRGRCGPLTLHRTTLAFATPRRFNPAHGGQAMTRLRGASAIAALSLLAWAATAHAECAWVIWRNSVALSPGSNLKDNWFAEQAVDKHQECEGIVNAKNNSESCAKDMAASSRTPRLMDYSYLCLPDTIDPRGVKGK